MLSGMLEKDPDKRSTICEVTMSPWLTRNDGDPIDLDLSSISSNGMPGSGETSEEEKE